MATKVRQVGSEFHWLTSDRVGNEWHVRVEQAAFGEVRHSKASGELSESEAPDEAWALFRTDRRADPERPHDGDEVDLWPGLVRRLWMARQFTYEGEEWVVELTGLSHGVEPGEPPRVSSWGAWFHRLSSPESDQVHGSIPEPILADLSEDELRNALRKALVEEGKELGQD